MQTYLPRLRAFSVTLCLRGSLLLAIGWFSISISTAHAGGGPESTALVVNQRSWASLTLANHYIHWRKIPASNVIYLDWTGPLDEIDVSTFIAQILTPVFTALSDRQLTDHIDLIVYSADFPWMINATQQMGHAKLPQALTPIGSLTGMTYFGSMLLKGDGGFLALNANHYARPAHLKPGVPATHGFHSWYGWGSDGQLLESGGAHYAMSTMLGVTTGRGNSVSEAVAYLQRAAQADATHPPGTIYYVLNEDVRSRTRRETVNAAVEDLKRLGVNAAVATGAMPLAKADVQGAMMGVEQFDWGESRSTIRPGAICENLTSFGGDLKIGSPSTSNGAPQTPLTEFLRYGAAGSSGTVVEPLAIQAKFPLPQMQVHYARGCSLAEAFYQSVTCPYQLLIVGDPLCQPWATPPSVTIAGLPVGQAMQSPLKLTPAASGTRGDDVDRFDWFLDGVRVANSARREQISLSTETLPDGYHELRAVATMADAIETQGRAVVEVVIKHRNRSAELTRSNTGPVRWGTMLQVAYHAPGATSCALVQGSRLLGTVNNAQGQMQLDPQILGYGPVRLRIVALGGAAPDAQVSSAPLDVHVEPNEPLPDRPLAAGRRLSPGFIVRPEGREPRTVIIVPNAFWLADAGVSPRGRFEVDGYLKIDTTDVYQFQIRHHGSVALEVDGIKLFDESSGDYQLRMVPIALGQGIHRVTLRGTAGDRLQMELGFGGPGIRQLNGTTLQHESP